MCWAAATLAILIVSPANATYYDVFRDGYYSDPNYWKYNIPDPNQAGIFRAKTPKAMYFDPNLYDPNVVPWDCDNPMWQIWAVRGDNWRAKVDSNGLNLWTSAVPTFPYTFIGAVVNTPPYTQYLYPLMTQDPNLSETFFSNVQTHYLLAHVKWHDPDKGEGVLGHHVDAAGWTGMFLGIQKHPGQQPYVYMHCGATGQPIWYGPGGTYNLDLGAGVWMLFQYDFDGDASVPNAVDPNRPNELLPLWKSAVWAGDKYAGPTAWNNAEPPGAAVMVSDAITGQPLVYKHFGSWVPYDPNDPATERYRWHPCGISLIGLYANGQTEDLDAWISINHVECRSDAEFVPVARRLSLQVTNSSYGRIDICPDLPDPCDPNTPDNRLLRYTYGTQVVLHALPNEGKSFKEWIIFDPNYPGDRNHAIIDNNSILTLTMDQSYSTQTIEAVFKCGSGLPPFIAVALVGLGVAVVIRRLS